MAEHTDKEQIASNNMLADSFKNLLREAFEEGCELYYDDNDGRSTMSQSLIDKKFKEWCELKKIA